MNYTSGTTGRPKGVRRPLAPFDPDIVGQMIGMFLMMFGVQPLNDNVHLVGSPLYHTAVLMFAGSSMHFGHTVVLMDKWTPESSLAVMERDRVTTSHMVPTQFHRLLALPEYVCRQVQQPRRCLRHRPRCRPGCETDRLAGVPVQGEERLRHFRWRCCRLLVPVRARAARALRRAPANLVG